jgi:hypothetical protein
VVELRLAAALQRLLFAVQQQPPIERFEREL